MVESFLPNISLNHSGKCRVCKLVRIDRNLFDEIHRWRVDENKSVTEIAKLVNFEIASRGLVAEAVSNNVIINHFNKHIPTDLIAVYKTQAARRSSRKVWQPEPVPEATEHMVSMLTQRDVPLYDKLENLYHLLDERFVAFDAEQDKKINLLNVTGYSILSKELRACLTELNKIKQNDQIIKMVLQTALTQYTVGTLGGVIKSLEHLKLGLRTYIKDTDTVERLVGNLRDELGESLETSGKDALETVRASFKLN